MTASTSYEFDFTTGSVGFDLWDSVFDHRGIAFNEANEVFYLFAGSEIFSVTLASIATSPVTPTLVGSFTDKSGAPLDAQGLTWREADGRLHASGGRSIYLLNLANRNVDRTFTVGASAELDGLANDWRTDKFYAANNGSGYVPTMGSGAGKGIVEITLPTSTPGTAADDILVASYPFAQASRNIHGVGIDPRGVLHLVQDRQGQVQRFDVDSGTYLTTVSGPTAIGNCPRGGAGAVYVEILDGDLGGVYCDGSPFLPSTMNFSAQFNSLGKHGEIRATGSAIAANNDVTLLLSHLPSSTLALGLVSLTPAQPVIFDAAGGARCITGNIGRFVGPGQIMTTDANGTASLQIDLTMIPQVTTMVAVQPGETWYFQAWHRDVDPIGNPTAGYTTALSIQFQ
ncbi:MAG: hypothetical protein AAF957_26825 [Planctomycetota bacterium]